MKQYEIRTKDLTEVLRVLTPPVEPNNLAKWAYREYAYSGYGPSTVLVLHDFETDAEADAARLALLETWHQKGNLVSFIRDAARHPSVAEAIDAARNAPKPSVKVIATPEGVV